MHPASGLPALVDGQQMLQGDTPDFPRQLRFGVAANFPGERLDLAAKMMRRRRALQGDLQDASRRVMEKLVRIVVDPEGAP